MTPRQQAFAWVADAIEQALDTGRLPPLDVAAEVTRVMLAMRSAAGNKNGPRPSGAIPPGAP